jgi:PAS domain S-box-containing protein
VKRINNSFDKTIYVILSFVDITEIKELREKLSATDRELSDIVEFFPDPTFVTDQSHRIIAWNRAMEDFTGVKSEMMIGTSRYSEVLKTDSGTLPLLIDLLEIPGDEISKKYPEVAIQGPCLIHESGICSKDGLKATWYLEKASPLLDKNGIRKGAIMAIRDITALKQFEASLYKAHGISSDFSRSQISEMSLLHDTLLKETERLKVINTDQAFFINAMNASSDLVIVLDNASRIQKLNYAMESVMENSGKADVIGRHISGLIAPEYRKIVLDFIADTEKESNAVLRYSLITNEGRVTVEASVSEIRDSEGEKSGYVLVQRAQDRNKAAK